MTPFRQVQWDGFGINDTDQFASRIAKFQNDYLSFGPEMARRWNAYEELMAAAQNARNVLAGLVSGDLKTIDANSPALISLRSAIAKAEGKQC